MIGVDVPAFTLNVPPLIKKLPPTFRTGATGALVLNISVPVVPVEATLKSPFTAVSKPNKLIELAAWFVQFQVKLENA